MRKIMQVNGLVIYMTTDRDKKNGINSDFVLKISGEYDIEWEADSLSEAIEFAECH